MSTLTIRAGHRVSLKPSTQAVRGAPSGVVPASQYHTEGKQVRNPHPRHGEFFAERATDRLVSHSSVSAGNMKMPEYEVRKLSLPDVRKSKGNSPSNIPGTMTTERSST